MTNLLSNVVFNQPAQERHARRCFLNSAASKARIQNTGNDLGFAAFTLSASLAVFVTVFFVA